jgi:signal transduction histidine kinase
VATESNGGEAATERGGPGRRRLTLTQSFLIVSVIVTTAAMAVLGTGVSYYIRNSIVEGIAETAATSMDSLVTNSLNGMFASQTLTDADRARLDRLLEIGGDAEAARLIQINLFDLDDRPIYQAGAITDRPTAAQLARARSGIVTGDIVDLPLDPTGPFGSHTISLLRLFTPLHRPVTSDVFAVAGLYYSTKSLVEIQDRAQLAVWTVVLIAGVIVVAALYAFVASADRTILRQATHLQANLAQSRRLSEQVSGLHQASEDLRVDAIEANEQLLARVGSDIHDGPLQLLTLVILQLTRAGKSNEQLTPTAVLAADAVAELRNISAGLILPELAGLTLSETIALAVRHYEAATGTRVHQEIANLDVVVEPDVQVCVYRVVQESLSNAFRHSGGLEQSVVGGRADGQIALQIANARHGTPDNDDAPMRPKLGLRGMRLRVEAVGGSLAVEMGEAQVVVRARIPGRRPPDVAAEG